MNKKEYELTNYAKKFAKQKHKGQKDDAGKDYFTAHLEPVAEIIKLLAPNNTNLIAAAYLHDTVEDTDTTFAELEKYFTPAVALLVLEVTSEKVAGKKVFPYLESKEGIMLKLADRINNLSRMENWPVDKQAEYIQASKIGGASK